MARDAVTVTLIDEPSISPPAQVEGVLANGLEVTVADAGDKVFIEVENQGAGELDVTLTAKLTFHGIALEDRVVAVPAGEVKLIPLEPMVVFRDSDDGTVWLDVEADDDLFFRAYKL